MNSQHVGGSGEMLLLAGKGLLNVEPLELGHGFLKENLSVQHLFDQGFKLTTNLHFVAFSAFLKTRPYRGERVNAGPGYNSFPVRSR
jgi:hypothetical protein